MVSLSSSVVGLVPISLPRRSTVTVSQKAFTSRNLWVMMTMVSWPSRVSFFRVDSTSSASSGVSTEVGSSRISRFRLR